VKILPLYKKIADDIEILISSGKLKQDEQLPIQEDLKKKYNTTRVTVNKGLKRLFQKQMIYSIRGKGMFVNSKNKVKKIKIIFLSEEIALSKYQENFFIKLHSAAKQKDMQCSVVSILGKALNKIIDEVLETSPTAAVIYPGSSRLVDGTISVIFKKLHEHKIPLIGIEYFLKNLPGYFVTNDNVVSGETAASYFLSAGYSESIYATTIPAEIIYSTKMRGFGFSKKTEEFLKNPVKKIVFANDDAVNGNNLDLIVNECKKKRTGIFAVNDFLADCILSALVKNDVAIPEQCGLIGYGNIQALDIQTHTRVPLATFDTFHAQIAEKCIEIIEKHTNGQAIPQKHLTVYEEFVSGGTVRDCLKNSEKINFLL